MYLVYNNNLESKISIKTFQYDSTQIIIIGSGKMLENTSGFKIYINEEDETEFLDFSNYITKYNVLSEIENGIVYTNNGSVEKEEDNFICPISVGTFEDTERIKILVLESMKQAKILESKKILEQYLLDNPLISTCHGGTEGAYNASSEKQNLMMSQYMTYQIEKQFNSDAKLTWNQSGEECEEWTEEEFLQLIMEMKQYVYPMVSYQQVIEKKIRECSSVAEIEALTIDYANLGGISDE